ncbi:MAG: cell wall-binding repeat-containing protein, partial [Herbiconiux sp.]|nr:cell wall-binding repeat-containing protein [Herbiconiux sp.]
MVVATAAWGGVATPAGAADLDPGGGGTGGLAENGPAEPYQLDAGGDPGALPGAVRLAGADRYEMSALIAQRVKPRGSLVVYIASGAGFADALSASPAAAHQSAP